MKLIISSLLLGMALSANAQNNYNGKPMPSFTHSFGGSYQQFKGLNGRVANNAQFEQLKDYTATLGLGWQKEHKRVISAGGITLGSSLSRDRDEKSSTIRYGAIYMDLGYDVIKNENIMLYPLAGLGFQHYQAIFLKDNRAVLFNDVLRNDESKNSISSVRFNNSFLVYRAGLGFSFKSAKHPGCSIWLQGGFTGSFKNNAWKSNENQVLGNAPVDKINQAFAGITFITTPKFMK